MSHGLGYRVKFFKDITHQTFGADDAILEKLTKSTSLRVEETNLQKCNIMIVFCLIISRVGSDVEAAMRNIQGNGKTCF